jgi:hypothetical protein
MNLVTSSRLFGGSEQPELPEACAILTGEDQMVDDRAVQCLGGAGETARGALVALAWCGIAARVVVSQNDSGASVQSGVGNDRAKREVGTAFIAGVASDVDAVRKVVEMGDPQAFAGRVPVANAAGEELAGCGQAVEFECKFGTLITHANAVRDDASASDGNRIGLGGAFIRYGAIHDLIANLYG